MAGVRSKPQPNGKFVGWYVNMNGRQKFFVGTTDEDGTLVMARRLEDEHRQIRLGYRPAPKSADKHRARPVVEAASEYLEWGRSQGGRGGRPWGKDHSRKRKAHLTWWIGRLGLTVLGDLDGILPKVERALRELQAQKRQGKTLANRREALSAFCQWAMARGYLAEDPLKDSIGFDTTPKIRRRALTITEIQALLAVAPEWRRLLYEVALTTGLRKGELAALTVGHLDVDGGGLRLDAAWTKNRRPGYQPLPSGLVRRLAERCPGKAATVPLLRVPSHTDRCIASDLEDAGIPAWTPEGNVDFHALRTTYATLVVESGANIKEAQALMRHSTPDLTLNVYARSRSGRLSELAEAVGKALETRPDNAACRTRLAAGAEGLDVTALQNPRLEQAGGKKDRGFDSPRLHQIEKGIC
jgi:integrase